MSIPLIVGKYEPCICGSNKKYKFCCWDPDDSIRRYNLTKVYLRMHKEKIANENPKNTKAIN